MTKVRFYYDVEVDEDLLRKDFGIGDNKEVLKEDIVDRARFNLSCDIREGKFDTNYVRCDITNLIEKENMSEVTFTLLNEFDIYHLFILLGNEINSYKNSNYKHLELIRLLEGNDNNVAAQEKLKFEKERIRDNNEQIKILDNIRIQLQSRVDKVIGK